MVLQLKVISAYVYVYGLECKTQVIHECEVNLTAGQKKIPLKEHKMNAFYKHLYAGLRDQ